jgi:hypothetical protein
MVRGKVDRLRQDYLGATTEPKERYRKGTGVSEENGSGIIEKEPKTKGSVEGDRRAGSSTGSTTGV